MTVIIITNRKTKDAPRGVFCGTYVVTIKCENNLPLTNRVYHTSFKKASKMTYNRKIPSCEGIFHFWPRIYKPNFVNDRSR